MNTKPIIGIAPNYSYEKKEYTLSEDYVLAIEKAGGCPIVLLPHQALPPFLDGLLLTGGGDIDPLLFGEEPLCQSGEINPLRDACEMRICEAALEKDLPMLGICRGMQVMNISSRAAASIRISACRQAQPSSISSRHPVPMAHTAFLSRTTPS